MNQYLIQQVLVSNLKINKNTKTPITGTTSIEKLSRASKNKKSVTDEIDESTD